LERGNSLEGQRARREQGRQRRSGQNEGFIFPQIFPQNPPDQQPPPWYKEILKDLRYLSNRLFLRRR